MKHGVFLFLATMAFGAAPASAAQTMRVDYYHTGNNKEERFSLDRIVIEPLPWAGNSSRPIDDTNLGKYFFEVVDAQSGATLYSRGFSSIYGEWETTAEAGSMNRTFSESLRFPAVEKPARIVVKKRDAKNAFQTIWTLSIDPVDKFIVRGASPVQAGALMRLHEAGDPARKLDLLILGDGYTAAERGKFERDARRLMRVLFATSPFKERQRDINVWGLVPPAARSGVSRPSQGIHRRTPVGATYDAFDSERYILTFDNRAWRDIAAWAPYEYVTILTNGDTYGGGGLYNVYSTAAAGNAFADYLFVHEFAHHFAGLADEYYTSPVAYEPPERIVEPWPANVTATADASRVKWRDLLSPGAPVPTPWPKEQFEAMSKEFQARRARIRAEKRPESEMTQLFREELEATTKLLSSADHSGTLGVFQGANYDAKAFYRPQIDCIMFTRNKVPFCRVYQQALAEVIDQHAGRASGNR